MKYQLTITDMTEKDVQTVTQKLFGTTVNVVNTVSKPVDVKIESAEVDLDEPTPEMVAATLSTETDVELDVDGLPWDERIHAGSKKQNKDGTWKRRQKITDELKKEVEAELRAAQKQTAVPEQATPVAPVQPVQPQAPLEQHIPATTAPVAPTGTPPFMQQSVAPVQPVQPQAPVEQPQMQVPVQQPVQQAQQVTGKTFPDLMGLFQEKLKSGSVNANVVNEICTHINTKFAVNIASINDVMGQQAMIDEAYNQLMVR